MIFLTFILSASATWMISESVSSAKDFASTQSDLQRIIRIFQKNLLPRHQQVLAGINEHLGNAYLDLLDAGTSGSPALKAYREAQHNAHTALDQTWEMLFVEDAKLQRLLRLVSEQRAELRNLLSLLEPCKHRDRAGYGWIKEGLMPFMDDLRKDLYEGLVDAQDLLEGLGGAEHFGPSASAHRLRENLLKEGLEEEGNNCSLLDLFNSIVLSRLGAYFAEIPSKTIRSFLESLKETTKEGFESNRRDIKAR